jgi:HSP20 family protein
MVLNLIRWNPYEVELRPFVSPLGLLEEVEEIAREAFENKMLPKLHLHEEDKELVVKGDLPGMRKRDLDIKLDDGLLIIKAERKTGKEGKKNADHTGQHRYERYVRCITLPTRVDAENITATLKKGRLEIRLAKAEAPAAKQIEIKTK